VRAGRSPDVSIVIPTRDGRPYLEEALAMIRGQRTRRVVEIVGVDSGSKDGTPELLERHGARVLAVAPGAFDHGLTRNAGIAASRGALLVLLTQDAVPADADWLEALLAPFDRPAVAGVYARQLPRADAPVLVRRNVAEWIAGAETGRTQSLAGRPLEGVGDPFARYELCCFDHVCGATRRDVWTRFPYRSAVFGEDLEWGKRVIEAGMELVFEPRARVVHSHDRSLGYEYARTYACHHRLHELFGICTAPRLRDALLNAARAGVADAAYAWRHEPRPGRRARAVLRAPAAAFVSNLAQWKGARDARRGRPPHRRRGV
jgi:rhamnosyltransferase